MEELLGLSHGLLVLSIVACVAILVVQKCKKHPLTEIEK